MIEKHENKCMIIMLPQVIACYGTPSIYQLGGLIGSNISDIIRQKTTGRVSLTYRYCIRVSDPPSS